MGPSAIVGAGFQSQSCPLPCNTVIKQAVFWKVWGAELCDPPLVRTADDATQTKLGVRGIKK
jgi:hypothetical protein